MDDILFFFFIENKSWHLIRTASLADDSHRMSRFIFYETWAKMAKYCSSEHQMFQVSWPFCSGVQNAFSRWWLSWISDRKDFSYFLSTSCHNTSYQGSSQLALWFRRRCSKWIFKMQHISCLGFSIWTILATFDVQVICDTSARFPLLVKKNYRNRFSRWQP